MADLNRLEQRRFFGELGNGSCGCSKAWLASEASASISPTAAAIGAPPVPSGGAILPRAPPGGGVQKMKISAIRTKTLSRESRYSIRRLSCASARRRRSLGRQRTAQRNQQRRLELLALDQHQHLEMSPSSWPARSTDATTSAALWCWR